MKKETPAHFEQVKRTNSLIIKNLLRNGQEQSISEIAEETQLSYPTVSSILKDLEKSDVVRTKEETKSCGGRPGVLYEMNSAFQYALILYFQNLTLQGRVYNACGQKMSENEFRVTEEIQPSEVITFIKRQKEKFPAISDVILGIPGAVQGHEILHLPKFSNLEHSDLADQIEQLLSVRVYIENDVNAIVLAESRDRKNFAHITYINKCVGVGIVLDGEVYKGCHGYAGEMESLCDDVKNAVRTFKQNILALSCVLDLPEILLSGNGCNGEMISMIRKELETRMPIDRIPALQLIEEPELQYERGLLERILLLWEKQL